MPTIDTLNINGISYNILMKNFLDKIYPIGSVYISITNTNPGTTIGGTWEQISQGKCLWGADSNHAGGSTIAAGLPNITGGCNYFGHTSGVTWGINTSNSSWFGAMDTYNGGGNCYAKQPYGTLYDTSSKTSGIKFDASKSNAIYGNSSTVQPPAYCVYMWKRTA